MTSTRRAFLWTLAIAPAIAHLIAFGVSVSRNGYIIFGRTDLAVSLLVVAYLLFLPFVLGNARRAGKVLLAVYSLLAAFAVAEWMIPRFLIPTPLVANYPWPPMNYVRLAASEVSPDRKTVSFTVNRFGVRGRDVDPASVDQSILCIGGSTTECLYVDDQASWPWLVERYLGDATKKSTFVGNAGRSGHIAANHAFLIRNYDAIDRFDGIVVMCGINDVGSLLRRDRDKRLSEVADGTLYEWNRPHEAYYRRLGLWRVMETILDVGTPTADGAVFQDATGDWYDKERKRRKDALAKRTFTDPPADMQAGLDAYRNDLVAIIQSARDRGVPIVMMTQPTLWRADLPPDLTDKLWEYTELGAYTPAALAQIMDAFNRTMIDVCAESNVPCLDLSAKVPKDGSVFYDDCHFHEKGSETVAKIVSDWLAGVLKSPN